MSSQAKITSFFTKSRPFVGEIEPKVESKAAIEREPQTAPDYDSDETDIYDYEEDIIELSKDLLSISGIGDDRMSLSDDEPKTQSSLINNQNESSACTMHQDHDYTSLQIEDSQTVERNLISSPRKLRSSKRTILANKSNSIENLLPLNDKKSIESEKRPIKKLLRAKRRSKATNTKKDTTSSVEPLIMKQNVETIIPELIELSFEEDSSPRKDKPFVLRTYSPLKLWTQTYQPKSATDIVGNQWQIEVFKQWLTSWHDNFAASDPSTTDDENDIYSDDEGKSNNCLRGKCLYIYGPTGVGKTCLVYSMARDCGYEVLEYNASAQKLTPAMMQKDLSESLQSHYINQCKSVANFFAPKPSTQENGNKKITSSSSLCSNKSKKNSADKQKKNIQQQQQQSNQVKLSKSLILIDDIDAIAYENTARSVSELWRTLRQMIVDARKPIVLTSSFGATFLTTSNRQIGSYLRTLRFDAIDRDESLRRLNMIFDENGRRNVSPDYIRFLFNQAHDDDGQIRDGDFRQLLNCAQFWCCDHDGDHASHNQSLPEHYQDNDSIECTIAQSDNLLASINVRTYCALIDSLSLEDNYRLALNRETIRAIENERNYDRYLHDNRQSICFDSAQCATLHRYQSSMATQITASSHITDLEPKSCTIKQLLRDYYLPPSIDSPRQTNHSVDVADYFAFFTTLDSMQSNFSTDLLHLRRANTATTNATATRLLPRTRFAKKSSIFKYF